MEGGQGHNNYEYDDGYGQQPQNNYYDNNNNNNYNAPSDNEAAYNQ